MLGRERLASIGALTIVALAAALPARHAAAQSPEDLARIDRAIPARAQVRPQKPRRLLIFDLNVGYYPPHASVATANAAFTRMGQRTGAFEAVVSRDPAVFRRESLRQFDAVLLNNTVGNLFEDPELRRNLLEFVTGGGGLMGLHGTSVAFTRFDQGGAEDWPEFGVMLGARGASHLEADERVRVRVEEPGHPLVRSFRGRDFDYSEEFFRFGPPFSRNRVRVLLSIDNERTARLQGKDRVHRFREDDDYALAWVRNYGRGRVFYSAIGHNPRVFWDPAMLRFYLDAAQFVLGDLPAPTVPSARLTPAIRAQERLGWRLGVEAWTFHRFSFFETIEKTSRLGLAYIGGLSFQRVSDCIPRNFDPSLSDDELSRVRMKLDEAGLRMLTFFISEIPADEAGARRVFEFGRKMGIETFMVPTMASLDIIERMADEYGINVGFHNYDRRVTPQFWSPETFLAAVEGRSRRIGAAVDMGFWIREGIDPVEGIRKLGNRLITIQFHDLHERSPQGHSVVWGTGAGESERVFREMRRLGIVPTMIGLEYSHSFEDNYGLVAQCVAFFDRVSLAIAGGRAR